jgi:hypothetical protein
MHTSIAVTPDYPSKPARRGPTFIRLVRTRADIADLTASSAHTTATKAPG